MLTHNETHVYKIPIQILNGIIDDHLNVEAGTEIKGRSISRSNNMQVVITQQPMGKYFYIGTVQVTITLEIVPMGVSAKYDASCSHTGNIIWKPMDELRDCVSSIRFRINARVGHWLDTFNIKLTKN